MHNFAKTFAKRAAVPITAAAVGATSAQARVSPSTRDLTAPVAVPKLEDEWVIPSVNGNKVFFKPFNEEEINECGNEIAALLWPSPSAPAVTISEVSPDGSVCSDGIIANEIIEGADEIRTRSAPNQNESLSGFLQLATKMLRRPGVQMELFASMMEDPEVMELMLTKCDNLDNYLLASGIGNKLLLQGQFASDAVVVEGEGLPSDVNGGDDIDLVGTVVGAVSSLLQRAGGALAALGGWLQGRLSLLMPKPPPAATDGTNAQSSEGERSGRKTAGMVLGCVTVLMVAMVCMLLVRHPPRSRFRRA